ncbi:AraC family transcriptional regulator, partial [Enterococcus faecalis]
MPEMEYMVVKTNEANLNMMTEKMLREVLPENNVQLAAAIQEHYLPNFQEGEVELYFPIEPIAPVVTKEELLS